MAKPALLVPPAATTHILLVEDDHSDAFLIKNMLDEHSATQYTTRHVTTQAEAILALREQTFDVCLLDLTLTDAIGFSALIDIQDKAPDMPVLLITGVNDALLANHAMGRGAQDYLLKDELEKGKLWRSIEYAVERKQVQNDLFQRANYDALTGLANRTLFESRLNMALARAERTGAYTALLFIDLDHFKLINDTYGHDAGDEVLKTVASRLKSVFRTYDTVARLGGDEFTVLLEGIASARDAAVIARKIIATLDAPVYHQGRNLTVNVSVGIMFCPTPMSSQMILKNADAAMYQAKKEGGNGYRFYAPNLHGKAKARLKLEEEISAALSGRQLQLYYQPYTIATEGKKTLGVEALLRWMHPERGLLLPDEFLAIAEQSKLMPEIGQWMFCELHRDIARWNAQAVPPLEIAFNIRASQLDMPDFMDKAYCLASEGAMELHRFVAEVSGNELLSMSESHLLALARLREKEILLHLDHFGHGPVSLQLLSSLPFSLLKLDLSLIKRMSECPQGEALIQTAIALAHQLGMKAGAVGVETQLQMQALQAHRCDALQGFLIGHPMTAEQIVQWVGSKAI